MKTKSNLLVKVSTFLLMFFSFGTIMNHSTVSAATSDNVQLPKAQGKVKVLKYSKENIKSVSDIYDTKLQTNLNAQVNQLQQKDQSFSNMLILANPYLTDTTSLYVHFKTDKPSIVSYKVSTGNGIPDFKRTLYNNNGKYSTNHSYQLIGLIGGTKNKVTITSKASDGTKQVKSFNYTAPKLIGNKENRLDVKNGNSKKQLSNGLYAFIGDRSQKQRSTMLVDNQGYIRGEIPIIGYNSLRLVQDNAHNMYFSLNSSKIAKINRLGMVEDIYNTGKHGYELHHDFVLDEQDNIVALATNLKAKKKDKIIEDRVVSISTRTGNVKELVNFKKLLPKLYKKATHKNEGNYNAGYHDPVHANSVQVVDNDSIIISSRETSSIIKIDNVRVRPTIKYMIADKSIWKDIGYTSKLLKKDGKFQSQAGQHSVNYLPSSKQGIYYLEMFNNNSAIMSSRPNFKWKNFPTSGKEQPSTKYNSYYYKYEVNENKGTYKLVKKIKVPYSPLISSVQSNDKNVIVDSGQNATALEYDNKGKLIRSFSINQKPKFLYRVYKYDFKDMYFR